MRADDQVILSVLVAVSLFVWCNAVVTTETSITETSTTSFHTTTPHTTTESETSSTTKTGGFWCLDDADTFETTYGNCSTYAPEAEYFAYCDEDFDANNDFSAQQVCPECGLCVYMTECIGDGSSFDAGWGNCSTYMEGLDNHDHCGEDSLNGTYASQACPECGRCDVATETETITKTDTATTYSMTTSTAHTESQTATTHSMTSTTGHTATTTDANTHSMTTTTAQAVTMATTMTHNSAGSLLEEEVSTATQLSGVAMGFLLVLFVAQA